MLITRDPLLHNRCTALPASDAVCHIWVNSAIMWACPISRSLCCILFPVFTHHIFFNLRVVLSAVLYCLQSFSFLFFLPQKFYSLSLFYVQAVPERSRCLYPTWPLSLWLSLPRFSAVFDPLPPIVFAPWPGGLCAPEPSLCSQV